MTLHGLYLHRVTFFPPERAEALVAEAGMSSTARADLKVLARCRISEVRAAAAGNRCLPEEEARWMATHETDSSVLEVLVRNPECPMEVVEDLMEHRDAIVAELAMLRVVKGEVPQVEPVFVDVEEGFQTGDFSIMLGPIGGGKQLIKIKGERECT